MMEDDDCDIVYAFIDQTMGTIPSQQDVRDVIYLPTEDYVNPLWAMYRYLQESSLLREPSTGDVDSTKGKNNTIPFDFVAHTWTNHILYTDRVWSRDIFDPNIDGDSVYDGKTALFSYGGSTGNPEIRDGGYRLLSSSLVGMVMNHSNFHEQVPRQSLDAVFANVVRQIGKSSSDVLDRKDYSKGQTVDVSDSTIIVHVPIPYATSSVRRGDFVKLIALWDRYKDNYLVKSYQDPDEIERFNKRANPQGNSSIRCCHGPRMLWGIMSVLDHDLERQRRQMIRETYLRYYIDINSTMERHRICPLNELFDTNHSNHAILLTECQLAYAFIVGHNHTGPTERLNDSLTEPITLPSPPSEPDVVVLNIKENMNDGKTVTYFKFGTIISDDHVYFDYIGKGDTDTLLYVNKFLDEELNTFPTFPDNGRSYGGQDLVAKRPPVDKDGVIYFAGSLYFLSPDLARFITSDSCNGKQMEAYHEDWDIGLFVDAHPLPVHRIAMKLGMKHPLKGVIKYRTKWKQHMESTSRN